MSNKRMQCREEVTIEDMPAATFSCVRRAAHPGPHQIGLLGSDEFHEWLTSLKVLVGHE
jgi:hypothetical protein